MRINHILRSVRAIFSIALLFLILPSCNEDKTNTIKSFKDVKKVPTLRTTNVSTLISDSGITRYRVVTADWSVYDGVAEPYWFFPKGVYLEKFDSVFHIEASIKADTAYFYEGKRLWVLRKNVKIKNLLGEKFETEELYWDQNQQKIYSAKAIKIDQLTRTILGIGFESNESMTVYDVFKPQGSFYVNEKQTQP